MSKKLTPWFPADVKPARTGVYEVRFDDDDTDFGYSYWSGCTWSWKECTPKEARQSPLQIGAVQDKKWRGLAKAPK